MSQFESVTDALIECVKACGGSKVVGIAIWPALGVEGGQRKLLNALNTERQEKLGPDEVMLVARLARDRGCHAYAQHLAHELSYAAPVPVEPRDELAELLRQSNELRAQLLRSSERIERLLPQAQTNPRGVA